MKCKDCDGKGWNQYTKTTRVKCWMCKDGEVEEK